MIGSVIIQSRCGEKRSNHKPRPDFRWTAVTKTRKERTYPSGSQMARIEVATFHQTIESVLVFFRVAMVPPLGHLFLVRKESLLVDGLADNRLDVVTATRSLNVRGEGPLADAPIFHGTTRIGILVTGHVIGRTPIGLTSDVAKVLVASITTETRQVDANVVGTFISRTFHTVSGAGPSRQGHAIGRTGL